MPYHKEGIGSLSRIRCQNVKENSQRQYHETTKTIAPTTTLQKILVCSLGIVYGTSQSYGIQIATAMAAMLMYQKKDLQKNTKMAAMTSSEYTL